MAKPRRARRRKFVETRGRKPLPDAQRKRNLTIRVTLQGLAQLARAARAADASVPDFVRAWIAGLE